MLSLGRGLEGAGAVVCLHEVDWGCLWDAHVATDSGHSSWGPFCVPAARRTQTTGISKASFPRRGGRAEGLHPVTSQVDVGPVLAGVPRRSHGRSQGWLERGCGGTGQE